MIPAIDRANSASNNPLETASAQQSGKLNNRKCTCLRRVANYLCNYTGYYQKEEVNEVNKNGAKQQVGDDFDAVAAKIAADTNKTIKPYMEKAIDKSTEALGEYLKGQSNSQIPFVGPSLGPSVDASMSGLNTVLKKGAEASAEKSTTTATGASAATARQAVGSSTSFAASLWSRFFKTKQV
jgi:gentisate 1,2-dioxygenase